MAGIPPQTFQLPQEDLFRKSLRDKSICGFVRGGLSIAPIEAFHAAGGVHEFLLAGEKRMASRADLQADITLMRGTRLKDAATGAMHCYLCVFGMDLSFQSLSPSPY